MMNNHKTLTSIVLAISCIRVLIYLIEYIGIKLIGNSGVNEFVNGVNYANSIINIAITLFIAYALNLIKEDIWRSIGFISSAFMVFVFLMISIAKVQDTNVFKVLGMINIPMVVFFIVQMFLIKNPFFKNAFIIYSITIILMVMINAAIPYIAYKTAIPISSIGFFSLLNVIPAAAECYIVYLFQQYFNSPAQYQNNDFTDNL